MAGWIGSTLRTAFLVFVLLVTMPTLLFLVKSYYSALMARKTYVGCLELPYYLDRADSIISSAKNLFQAPQIKAVVIAVDGQGGNPGACQALHSDLIALKKTFKKPLIAYCQRFCSSGSYLVATAADEIVMASPTRIDTLGIFTDKNDIGAIPFENQKYEYWKTVRKMRLHKKDEPEGKIITGRQALDLGLIDHLGGTMEVERVLRSKGIIDGRIEEVHGSWAEHFMLTVTSALTFIIKGVKQAWTAGVPEGTLSTVYNALTLAAI